MSGDFSELEAVSFTSVGVRLASRRSCAKRRSGGVRRFEVKGKSRRRKCAMTAWNVDQSLPEVRSAAMRIMKLMSGSSGIC